MSRLKKDLFVLLVLAVATGCAGWNRSCAASCAESFGADWVVVQYTNAGDVLHCWQLSNTSITNEPGSDGIYWQAPSGNLVHISGWYNRVQVGDSLFARDDRWTKAAADLRVDIASCSK